MEQPRFAPHLAVQECDGEGVLLVSDGDTVLLRGRLTELVARLVDGRRTAVEIAEAAAGRASAAEIFYTLDELERRGHLVEATTVPDSAGARWWSARGVSAETAEAALAVAVRLDTVGSANDTAVRRALAEQGLAVADDGAGLRLVLTDDYLRPELATLNAEALRDGRPWLLLQLSGTTMLVGPLFQPGTTACWSCLSQRMRGARAAELFLQEASTPFGTGPVPVVYSLLAATLATNLAVTEAVRWVVEGSSGCSNTVLAVAGPAGNVTRHAVVRRPQCERCGDPAVGEPTGPVRLGRPVAVDAASGHRAATADQTLERFVHHVSARCGAVTALEPIAPPGEAAVHVYRATYGLVQPITDLTSLRNQPLRSASGKGATDLQAKVSGLCEALERFSAQYAGSEALTRASRRQLGELAIDPNAVALFSDSQFAQRDSWNAREAYFCRVPRRPKLDRPIDWTRVWSLASGEVRLLPAGLCYLDTPAAGADDVVESANGLASGTNVEEAVLHGLLELIERDSAALWWYHRLRRPALDWSSFGDERVSHIGAYLAERGRNLWVLDLTADTGVTVLVALSRRTDGGPEHVVFGFGAHLDPQVALVRAVTELVQMSTWVIDGSGTERVPRRSLAPAAADWLTAETVQRQPFLLPDDTLPGRSAADYTNLRQADLGADVALVRDRLADQHLEVFVRELTRPDVGLPVVRVVAPGLRPLWPRFAPGRLFDVPVRLGWAAPTVGVEDLNPIPMFL